MAIAALHVATLENDLLLDAYEYMAMGEGS
jgi:hypothetical protein